MRGIYPLVLSLGCVIAAAAVADPYISSSGAGSDPRPQAGVQLAQVYEFQVYIDERGREVVVDPRTNRIVEVREPFAAPPPPPPSVLEPDRNWNAREDGRNYYDFTDPRDLERFHREREEAIYGRAERDPYPDRGGYGNNNAPDYASYPEENRNGSAYPEGNWPQSRENPGRGGVYRVPLDPPSQNEARSVMPLPDAGGGSSMGQEPLHPDINQSPEINQGPKINQGLEITVPGARGASGDVAKFQVLLDRAGASPGVIDGRMGDNVNKAISAYHEITGERLRTYDKEWIEAELQRTGGPAFIEYMITSEDAAGPFIASVPADYGEKATLERLSYTRVTEMLAERFHMDEKYLIALNPGVNFDRPGTIIKVANSNVELTYEVGRIVADKARKQLRIYDTRNRLVASYPATIGSESTPSPVGTHTVERVAMNPEYTYNPKINFKQGNNNKVLKIPPGPNGPVGSVWIALSKPTYGIHGTPDPEKIGKTYSNGCIRLTNWDAEELAKRVTKGVTVEFI